MKRWAIMTILLYAAILVALIVPVYCISFWRPSNPKEILGFIPLWIWLGLMVLTQVVMLVLPVRVAQQRPVTKIWIFWPMLAAGVMFVILTVGMGFVLYETLFHAWGRDVWMRSLAPWAVLAGVVGFWLFWMLAFGFFAGKDEPPNLIRRSVHWLIAGSIVELLIAIPAHVYARAKDHCCGGFYTVWGLAAGIAVMLFAFGPGVFFLFIRRLKSIQNKSQTKA